MTSSEALLGRLDEQAVPLASTDPEAPLDDLRPLAETVASARIVGLGEATHGTREFFRMKHRLVRYLVEEHGFRLFGLEANFAETMAINDYVIRGEGDPKDALEGIYFWTWNTEEVLALVEWLREFNEDRDEDDRVTFYGYDAQFTAGPAEAVEEYLQTVDPEFLEANRDVLEMLADEGLRADDGTAVESELDRAEAFVSELEERFEERKNGYVAETSDPEWELARQHVRTMAQAVEQRATMAREEDEAKVAVRDAQMAENVSWILDREEADRSASSRSRIALWAHNAHVKTGEARGHWGSAQTMGEHLRREYGEEYYALGFEFGRGSLRSLGDPDDDEMETELREFTIEEPFDGGVADTLSELDREAFLLDFESAAEDSRDDATAAESRDDGDSTVAEWLADDHLLHSIGAIFYANPEKHRSRYALADELDGLVYLDETSAAVPVSDES